MPETISADRLADLLDRNEQFVLIDTRDEASFDSWHISGAKRFPFGPNDSLNDNQSELMNFIDGTDRVVTICAKGISSDQLAVEIERAGLVSSVANVSGGMEAWSRVYETVEIDVDDPIQITQVQRRAKGCLGYVLACTATDRAVVVDPTADLDEIESLLETHEYSLVGVIDTHVHADHVSGGHRLAKRYDVPYYLSARAAERGISVDYETLARNEVLAVGSIDLKALETPGHTSEMLSILVDDQAVLTADTLHVDSTGRTELEFADDGEEGARMLYESLHRTILSLPENIVVLPGHVPVTADGHYGYGAPGKPIFTTIGRARTEIAVLSADKQTFIDRVTDTGRPPDNYESIIEINASAGMPAPEQRLEIETGPNNCSV